MDLEAKLKILLLTAILAVLIGIGVTSTFAGAAEVGEKATVDSQALGLMALGAGIAIGIPGIGAALALGMATSAIAAAGAERPEIIGRFFIFIVFIEAIAIYALIVAIFIITMLPAYL
jgi:F0F1-type ATP synthase membrane subunit c/vacuolar-type H+-ATPase subunit K